MPLNRYRLFGLLNLVILICLAAWIWLQNQPKALVAPDLSHGQKLQCASYAPYYTPGSSPFVKGTHISKAQIEHDLALLAQRFDCVRTYSVGQGLDYVPEAASKIGLEVILGVWIGWTKAENDKELALGIQLANQYPEVIRALVVGNEVLLRQEQSLSAMQAYLARASASTDVPVTYADVWEFWLKYPALEASVDFVTAHVLPYWEDEPQAIEDAILHAERAMQHLDEAFTKPLFIGETGWPSVGRHRNASAPSQLNQARYIREFIHAAEQHGWRYNLIEAFDQPWKRVLEGTVGGNWGLYSSDLTAKFSLTAPVAERQDNWCLLLFVLSGTALIGILAAFASRSVGDNLANILFSLPMGANLGLMAHLQVHYLAAASRDTIEWVALGSVAVAGWLIVTCLPTWLIQPSTNSNKCLRMAAGYLVLTALLASTLILFDGRYRDFPLSLYLLPALLLGLVLPLARYGLGRMSRVLTIVACLALLFNLITLWFEPLNRDAWLWQSLCLLLLVTTLHSESYKHWNKHS